MAARRKPMSPIKGEFAVAATFTIVSECTVGKIYVCPGLGPVECMGTSVKTIDGMKYEFLDFTEVIPLTSLRTLSIPVEKIQSRGVRLLSTPDVLEKVVAKIEAAVKPKGLPGVWGRRVEAYDKLVGSANLDDLAMVICDVHGEKKRPRAEAQDGQSDRALGPANRALHMIASEYAVVNEQTFGCAMNMLSEKSGRDSKQAVKEKKKKALERI